MPRPIKTPSKITQSARDVLFHAIPKEFRIKGIVVNPGAVLHHIMNGIIKDITEKIHSLMESKSNHQVRRTCVFKNIQPYLWRILRGRLKRTRKF